MNKLLCKKKTATVEGYAHGFSDKFKLYQTLNYVAICNSSP